MNSATLETSPRLQRTLKALRKASRPLTTRQLMKAASICAVNSCVSELRDNGVPIKCQRKGKYYYYSLED